MEREKYCKLAITNEGELIITMPDGTVIPKQCGCEISQDLSHYKKGLAKVKVELLVNTKKD
jgi:hypothetical protein